MPSLYSSSDSPLRAWRLPLRGARGLPTAQTDAVRRSFPPYERVEDLLTRARAQTSRSAESPVRMVNGSTAHA